MKNCLSKLSLLDGILFISIFFLYFYDLGSYGLLNNNEGLYAEIPREMIERGHYIVPYLNGVPYIEKPPLLYWLIALSYRIGGVSEITARLVPATAGIGIVLSTYFFARLTTSPAAARLSALILATMGGLIIFSRMVFFDVLLTFFLTAALLSFFRWHQAHRQTNLRFFYFFLALAVMTKGIVAFVLAFLASLIFLTMTRTLKRKGREFLDPWGISLFLALLLPWHIVASFQEKEFVQFYFINEHFLRFLGLRIPKDYYHGPWHYYLPRLFLTALPWSFIFPLIFRKSPAHKPLTTFLWVWILVFFSFFSFSQAKANYYLVTIFPALALLLALKLETFSESRGIKRMRQGIAVSLAVFLPCLGLLALHLLSFFPSHLQPYIAVLPEKFFWLWLEYSLIALCCLKYLKRLSFWPETVTAFQMIPFLVISLVMARQAEPLFSARKFMQEVSFQAFPLILYRDFEKISSVRFYGKQNLPIIESLSDDLYFGLRTPQGSSLHLSSKELRQLLSHQDIGVIVFHEQRKNFEKSYPHADLIHQKGQIFLYKIRALSTH